MISLYIHIPFCKKKCSYCDFCSYTDLELRDRYIDTLIKEIILYSKILNDKSIKTIFIGGGTPSLLSSKNLYKIFKCIYDNFEVIQGAEISIEANPESISMNFLDSCLSNGINRLSVGVQSLDDKVLKTISRIHNRCMALDAVQNAVIAGFKNINVDLIYGLPNQDLNSLLSTVSEITSCNITHISAYNLIVENGTKLKNFIDTGKITIPDEDLQIAMYHSVRDALKKQDFFQYEISNYSKPGYECKHNLIYWEHGDYLGFGVAAHSFLKRNSSFIRFYNPKNIKKYFDNVENNLIFQNQKVIHLEELEFERIMLGFRLVNGFSIRKFNKDFSCDFIKKYSSQIAELKNEDLIEINNDRIRLTPRGLELENSILLKFMQ